MAEKRISIPVSEVAKPVHIQRLEKSLDLGPFLSNIEQAFNNSVNDEDSNSTDDDYDESFNSCDDFPIATADDVSIDKSKLYNFSNIGHDRKWLQNVLQESSDSSEETSADEVTHEDYISMLKYHALQMKYKQKYYADKDYTQYQYYSAGILSNYDKYPEHQKNVSSLKRKRREKDKRTEKKVKRPPIKKEVDDTQDESYLNYGNPDWDEEISHFKDEFDDTFDMKNEMSFSRKKNIQKNPEVMAARRKKVWVLMCKKEVGKVQRAKANNHKEMLVTCKKTAQLCMRHCRQKAMQSQKSMKEALWRAKRLTREMQAYWKRYDRVERENRRRLEKEAEEQRKMDVEMIEAKRQQRKLNFLITQTELYAHFMSRKLGKASPEEQLRILSQLDEEKNPRLVSIDDYDCEAVKAKAKKNAKEAFDNERARTKQFDLQAKSNILDEMSDDLAFSNTNISPADEEHPQPNLFKGNLKGYQLRGMNWLANLYDQGISGILADEMGLGKTVQSIAFLCHIAEKYSVWGPFLIISPASTLHNWQQEMERFVPNFKVVPYWGSPNERKILRQFWDQKDMHTKEASFHVVITSYQIVIADIKYFNRIKWQYMILDEAQAIKSANSARWKTLLGFSCRNRLLLSGTPIQNSMAELWALLHFIMPSLFDSHDEFNEWFSKDIESHAENKTGIDEKHLSRLHMILKPFMLRRIKKDVENELSDKIEIMVYCPLTTRQKLLYMALKKKIRIEDLLHYTISGGNETHTVDRTFTSNLMNLVMQFRKVCNHPELFERRDVKSPLYVDYYTYDIPNLIYNEGILSHNIPSKRHIIYNKFYIFSPEHISDSLKCNETYGTFSFMYYLNIYLQELYNIMIGDLIFRWKHYFETEDNLNVLHEQRFWKSSSTKKSHLLLSSELNLSLSNINSSAVLKDMVFTAISERKSIIYAHINHSYYSMPETMEHRIIRSRVGAQRQIRPVNIGDGGDETTKQLLDTGETVHLLNEFIYEERRTQIFECQKSEIPRFLVNLMPKVQCRSIMMYCNNRSAQWDWLKYVQVHSWQGLQSMWDQCAKIENEREKSKMFVAHVPDIGGIEAASPLKSWSNIIVPDKETLVTDAGKLSVLDSLLKRLKEGGHRVLIYSQMTKMIDLLEEYMWHRKHKYMRLDGSSKISERRDMVADFQARTDIFVFLLSTRAGGLGINLTAADTVIFYDSDWNPTVDQQAMDRAHRLGQTKQVTVYRLICKGSIEERILQRAREKSEIQRMVISGGNFKPDTLKPKEVVSLLLDDEEIEMKYRQRTEERRQVEEQREREKERERERKRKQIMAVKSNVRGPETKKIKLDPDASGSEDVWLNVDSCPPSPTNSDALSEGSGIVSNQEDTSNEALIVDLDPNAGNSPLTFAPPYGSLNRTRVAGRGQSKRGRPRGSRRTLSVGRPAITSSQTSGYSTGMDSSFESAQSTSSLWDSQSPRGGSPIPVRRGPGRPRLKPGGPSHQGVRGITRPRKPARPLPVPIRSGNTSNTPQTSSATDNTMNYCFYEAESK